MNENFNEAYTLCEAEDDKVLAVVTKKRGRLLIRDADNLVVKECRDDAHALIALEATIRKNNGKLSLSESRNYNASEKEYKLTVEYRLPTDNSASTGQSLREFLCYTYGSHIDMLVINCEDRAKCIVRCDEIFVYAANDISTAEIQSREVFIRNLEDSKFREQHGIFCIAETYSPMPTYDSHGIVFLDLSKMTGNSQFG